MLETASRNGISLFFDCYFWGLNKNESDVTLTYIIADWDCIHKVSHQYNKLLCYNLENLKSSIIGFIQEFVVEENQNYYKNLIWQLFEDRIKQEQYI